MSRTYQFVREAMEATREHTTKLFRNKIPFEVTEAQLNELLDIMAEEQAVLLTEEEAQFMYDMHTSEVGRRFIAKQFNMMEAGSKADMRWVKKNFVLPGALNTQPASHNN